MEAAVVHQSHRCTLSKSPCLHHHLHHHHHHHHLHHHHHHHHHHCALHCHPHLCPSFPSPIPSQNLQPLASLTSPKDVNPSVSQEPSNSNALILQEQKHEGLEEEDDEEPVFVLTDEWMEFFAKSEAKRKLEKKQAKKKRKS
ncbi:SKI/DACH domain-containing protein 1-like [Vitis riparia]|uniref:SKI/DACH domain-containing protein 1-like n=1 Tax=Vitis riparia TaxID=96939 RepID=UPI00155AB9E1|nr:SKI/DACH domain-containing protein 1-like [Vitis riparia]